MKETSGKQQIGNREEMEVLIGFSPCGTRLPAVGRLTAWGSGGVSASHGACLRVCAPRDVETLTESACDGMILVGDCALSQGLLQKIASPILIVPELPMRCLGKIAVLDPAVGRLFVSPDLPTLTRYASCFDGRRDLSESVLRGSACRADAELCRILPDASGEDFVRETGYLIDLRKMRGTEDAEEERVYERCCDFADVAAGTSVTVVVHFDRAERDHEIFRAILRGIFRAAVYGNFSVTVGGCLFEDDWQNARAEMHRAFCELAAQGREFNGYIAKGALVEAAIYPMSGARSEGADFVCLDILRLATSLTGLSWEGLRERPKEWQSIGAALTERMCGRLSLPLRVWLPETFAPRELCRALLERKIAEWYLPMENRVERVRYLRDVWESRAIGQPATL